MKKMNFNLLMVLALVFSVTLITSCGDDDKDVCNQESYADTFTGNYFLNGLLPLDEKDIISISIINDDSLSVTTDLLGTTFSGAYDAAKNIGTVKNLEFNSFVIGQDTLYDITVGTGRIELDGSCEKLYITLENVTVNAGTIVLPADLGLSYPLKNVKLTTKNGMARVN